LPRSRTATHGQQRRRRPGGLTEFPIRVAAATAFITFGAAKVTNHASELASIEGCRLPVPEALVYVIGGVAAMRFLVRRGPGRRARDGR